MAEKKAESKKDKGKKKGGGRLVLLMVLFGCLVPFGIPTLLVCMGLIPTIVALFTDTDSNRSSLAAIGYMNLAGVTPFLLDLWRKGQTMEAARQIIGDPFSWVVMLGSAGVGYLMLYIIPPFVASLVIARHEDRLQTLRDGMKQLELIWGQDVANMSSLEVVRRHNGVE